MVPTVATSCSFTPFSWLNSLLRCRLRRLQNHRAAKVRVLASTKPLTTPAIIAPTLVWGLAADTGNGDFLPEGRST